MTLFATLRPSPTSYRVPVSLRLFCIACVFAEELLVDSKISQLVIQGVGKEPEIAVLVNGETSIQVPQVPVGCFFCNGSVCSSGLTA